MAIETPLSHDPPEVSHIHYSRGRSHVSVRGAGDCAAAELVHWCYQFLKESDEARANWIEARRASGSGSRSPLLSLVAGRI